MNDVSSGLIPMITFQSGRVRPGPLGGPVAKKQELLISSYEVGLLSRYQLDFKTFVPPMFTQMGVFYFSSGTESVPNTKTVPRTETVPLSGTENGPLQGYGKHTSKVPLEKPVSAALKKGLLFCHMERVLYFWILNPARRGGGINFF